LSPSLPARIAAIPGYEVVLFCRDASKAQAAVEDIQRRTYNTRVRSELVDLARLEFIEALFRICEGER